MKKDNDSAYTDLIMRFSDIVSFGLVDEAATRELPEEDAALAWKNYINWHDPKTTSNKVQLILEFIF
jgi:hypothetical protein